MESISNQPTPQDSGLNTPEFHSTIDTLSEQDEGTMTPPSKQTTPATSPQSSFRLGLFKSGAVQTSGRLLGIAIR